MADALDRVRSALADRYTVDRVVGEGGMATVYLAHDLKHERMVAIKVLRPELGASLGSERFLREIRLAAQLQHPNILALYDSGAADGLLYYVMPFVEGESLRDRLTRERQLPIDEAIRIAQEAADALHFAHTRGVIHRDVKPENIMLLGGHVLVADFGIARALSEAGADKLTQTGMTLGTPYYMSPEQAAGGPIDGRSDLYSLSCVLYEILVGQSPFDGPNALAIMARHAMEDPRSMQVVRKTIPDELEEVVFGALAKSPADRFATLHEFSEALAAIDLSNVVHRTTPRTAMTGTSHRIRAQRRRRQIRRAAMIAGGALVVAAGGWFVTSRMRGGAVAAAGPDPRSIAVLYFENRSPNDSLNYVAEGLTEALIGKLSGVEGLRVVSSNGVAPFRGTNVSPDSVGRALAVGTLVTGTLGQTRDSLRLSVSLVTAASGQVVETKELRRARTEVFALEDELTSEVATFLRQRLGREVTLSEAKAGTRNTQAWETLLRANEASRDADSLFMAEDTIVADRLFARADSLYAAAATLDKHWAAPNARRGWIDFRQSRLRLSAPAWYNKQRIGDGLQHAERALALEPGNADALELRGTLRYWRWLNNLAPTDSAAALFSEAEGDLRAAVQKNPIAATAWTTLSHLLINKPANAEAKLAAMRAYNADPYLASVNTTLWRLFITSYAQEDAVEAQRWCDEGERRFPNDSRFAECHLWTYTMDGVRPDLARGWLELERYAALSPPTIAQLNRLKGGQRMAIALARSGLRDSAQRVAARARGNPTVDPGRELAELEAIVHAKRGDFDAAFEQLSNFFAANPQRQAELGDQGPWELKELRSDPRFSVMMRAK